HETCAVRMPEVFEIRDLQLVSRLASIQVIDDFVARAKPNQVDIKFVANCANQADQILVLLFGPVLVALPVNKPGDLRIRSDLAAQLFSAQTRRPHKVRPPMIVRDSLVFFPFIHRRSTNQDYVFTPDRRRGTQTERDHRQEPNEHQTFYHLWREGLFTRVRYCASSSRDWRILPRNVKIVAHGADAPSCRNRWQANGPGRAVSGRFLRIWIHFATHKVSPRLPLSDQHELIARNQRFCRERARIVVRPHHKSVRARAHDCEQIAFLHFRHFPAKRKKIARLTHRPDNVDLANLSLPLSLWLVHRHNFVIALVQRRPDEIVHSRIQNIELYTTRLLDVTNAREQNAGVTHKKTARFDQNPNTQVVQRLHNCISIIAYTERGSRTCRTVIAPPFA